MYGTWAKRETEDSNVLYLLRFLLATVAAAHSGYFERRSTGKFDLELRVRHRQAVGFAWSAIVEGPLDNPQGGTGQHFGAVLSGDAFLVGDG